jgi:hypothetical protein
MTSATLDDIKAILGNLDPDKLLAIVELQPSTAELEEVTMWLSGDRDVFGTPEPLKGTVSEIVTILTADDEEEEQRG